MAKPYAEGCDRNRGPILSVIDPLFADCKNVLEIGSGTGQHAVYFATKMPHLVWHTSDVKENHADIKAWLYKAELSNDRATISYHLIQDLTVTDGVNPVFSANTA